MYHGCSNPDRDSGGDWCPTELTNGEYISKSGKWGYCRTYENEDDIPNFDGHWTACPVNGGWDHWYYAEVDGCRYWYDEVDYEIYFSAISCEDL